MNKIRYVFGGGEDFLECGSLDEGEQIVRLSMNASMIKNSTLTSETKSLMSGGVTGHSSYVTIEPTARTLTRRVRGGFSLLELTLVLAIIGILIASAGYSFAGAGARAKAQVTRGSLDTIKGALQSYNLTFSAYPPSLRTLVDVRPPFLEDKKLQDAWSREFLYNPTGRNKEQPFELGSGGEDGIPGNEDDINVWTMNK